MTGQKKQRGRPKSGNQAAWLVLRDYEALRSDGMTRNQAIAKVAATLGISGTHVKVVIATFQPVRKGAALHIGKGVEITLPNEYEPLSPPGAFKLEVEPMGIFTVVIDGREKQEIYPVSYAGKTLSQSLATISGRIQYGKRGRQQVRKNFSFGKKKT